MRSTASRNSSSNRNVPRSWSSLATMTLIGQLHVAAEAELDDDPARPDGVEGAAEGGLVARGLEEDVERSLVLRVGCQSPAAPRRR